MPRLVRGGSLLTFLGGSHFGVIDPSVSIVNITSKSKHCADILQQMRAFVTAEYQY